MSMEKIWENKQIKLRHWKYEMNQKIFYVYSKSGALSRYAIKNPDCNDRVPVLVMGSLKRFKPILQDLICFYSFDYGLL